MIKIIQRLFCGDLVEENKRLKSQLLEEKTITIAKVNSLDVKKDDILVVTSDQIFCEQAYAVMSANMRAAFEGLAAERILLFEGGCELSIVKVKGK